MASGKGQGKDKAKVFMVVSPTLTFRDAAERLGCEVADLWRLYEAGKLPGVVVLGQRFIEEAHLERVRTALYPTECHTILPRTSLEQEHGEPDLQAPL